MDGNSTIRRCSRLVALFACGVVAISAAGCILGPRPRVVQPVPPGVIIGAETNARENDRGQRYTGFTVPVDAMLYIFDATDDLLIYSGPIVAGDTVRLFPGVVTVLGEKDAMQPTTPGSGVTGRVLAEYQIGHTVRAYYAPVTDSSGTKSSSTPAPAKTPPHG